MAESINIAAYSDALVVLGTAGVVVPLVRSFGISPVLGYLGAGAILGPMGLGSFLDVVPALYWVTVVDAANVSQIAELGVVFLLFLIGLELSFARLMAMRRLVFGFGAGQVVISAVLIGSVLAFAGQPTGAAAVIGACLALSSTAIVIELLSAQGRLTTTGGRTAFAVLLAQDLAVIPILLLVAVLAANTEAMVLGSVVSAVLQGVFAFLVIVVLGRFTLRPLFRVVASARSTELLIATILFVIVGTGVLAAVVGVSMALGAFVAGLLLAETEYRKAIQSIVEPFKGLLLGIFFFTVGMSIDFREVLEAPLLLVASIVGLLTLKAAVIMGLGHLFGLSRATSAETAMMLAPGGEFAFVGIGAALAAGVVDPESASFALTVASTSMVLIPGLVSLSRRVEKRLAGPEPRDPQLEEAPGPASGHTIVVGHGRVGKVVCSLLAAHTKPFVAIDLDALGVSRDRKHGEDVYYGDAANPSFLISCGIAEAVAVVITINDPPTTDAVVAMVREMRPDVPIFARARDAAHARHLYGIGVTHAVPETIEASLQLSETALTGIGVPAGTVIAAIHERRDEVRRDLQLAALRSADRNGERARAGTPV